MMPKGQWNESDAWVNIPGWGWPQYAAPRPYYPYWYGNPVPLLPWTLRGDSASTGTNWFTQSYPVLSPYYPVGSPAFGWYHPYFGNSYQGYWWP